MKNKRKISARKSIDKVELSVSCRDLGKADHEGWLLKKAGGHGLVPIMWKRYWCVVKDAKLYCYKTSFDSGAADVLLINDYSIENITEKKKVAFCMKPTTDSVKTAIFAGSTEDEVKQWIDVLNKILSGVDISQKDDANVPDYEERKRVFSSGEKDSPRANRKRHSSAFQKETETTGLPTSFSSRTTNVSTPRARYGSTGGKAETVLSVGSMFKPLEESEDTGPSQKLDDASEILYQEEISPEVVVETDPKDKQEPTIDTLLKEVEQLKTGQYHLQERNEPKINGNVDIPAISVTTESISSESPDTSQDVCIEASDDSAEVMNSTLSSTTAQSPTLSTTDEVFDVPVSAEVSLEHSLNTTVEISSEDKTETAISEDVSVGIVQTEVSAADSNDKEITDVENQGNIVNVKPVPLKPTGEIFYTGEETKVDVPVCDEPDENVTEENLINTEVVEGGDKESLPDVVIDTEVGSVVIETASKDDGSDTKDTVSETLPETLSEVSAVLSDDDVSTDIVVTEEKNETETSAAADVTTPDGTGVFIQGEILNTIDAVEETKNGDDPSTDAVQEESVPSSEVVVVAEGEEIKVEDVTSLETAVQDVAVSGEVSEKETEKVVLEVLHEQVIAHIESTEGADEVSVQTVVLTESSDADINNEQGGICAGDVNLSVEEDNMLSGKSEDESMIDAILKVSRDSSSTGDESMMDAVLKISVDSTETNADVSDVDMTEKSSVSVTSVDSNCITMEISNETIETSDAPIETSEMVIETNTNGDIAEKLCNGDATKVLNEHNTCNGNTPKAEVTISTCNGDTPKGEKAEHTYNGNGPTTTISSPESDKSINNSLIEYI